MSLFPSQIIIAAIMVIDNTLYFTEAQYRFRDWAVGFLNKLVRSVFVWSSLNESCCFFVLRREKAKYFPHFDGCRRGAGQGEAVPWHRGQRVPGGTAAFCAPGTARSLRGPPVPAGAARARRDPQPRTGRRGSPPSPQWLPGSPPGPGRSGAPDSRSGPRAGLPCSRRLQRPGSLLPGPRCGSGDARLARTCRSSPGSSAPLQGEAPAELGRCWDERREAGAVRCPGLTPGEQ